MTALANFAIAFILSFAGSIPPGTINLTVVQFGIQQRFVIALRFALAASAIEYPYAWIAVKFERLITASPFITQNIQLLAAIVLIILGLMNVWPHKKSTRQYFERYSKSGYRKGLLLGILNPLAIPYWIGMTAYLRGQGWIELTSHTKLHAYLFGVFLGAFVLLVLLAYLSKKVMAEMGAHPWINKIPGFLLITLGLYSILDYIL
jgi:threonine/homoserine/homoserine lactone efflux protein